MIRLLAPLAVLFLAGCASRDANTGPSLLPRAIEGRSFDEPAPPPTPVAQPDPALDAQIATFSRTAQDARTAFAAANRQADTALAAGARARVGSDAWLDAQTALAALDEPRAELLAALTGLEQLAISRGAAGQPPYPALEAARVEVDAALDRVTAVITERKARLPL